jgi:hypothetical protein
VYPAAPFAHAPTMQTTTMNLPADRAPR